MRALLASLFVFTAVAGAVIIAAPPPIATACSGGISQLDWYALEAEDIFLATALDVGGPENRAPTLTPPPSPTPTQTTPFWETPPATAVPTFDPGPPPDINLAGLDATFRIDAVYAGDVASALSLGQLSRSLIERELREWEAGVSVHISSCELDAFLPRYEAGGQYLMFQETSDADPGYLWAVFRIRDGRLDINNDPLLAHANQNVLYTTAATYHRFFEGYGGEVQDEFDYARVEQPVPLATFLRAVTHLRGGPIITAPETGTAGLKDPAP